MVFPGLKITFEEQKCELLCREYPMLHQWHCKHSYDPLLYDILNRARCLGQHNERHTRT
jgi:hypothetical protein